MEKISPNPDRVNGIFEINATTLTEICFILFYLNERKEKKRKGKCKKIMYHTG